MTLTARLSLFFLTTLALALAGFSAALLLLASVYLHRQAEERLDGAVSTLAAAAEVGPDGVEWEPAERHLDVGPGAFGGQVVWVVTDDRGRAVDRSARPEAEALLADPSNIPGWLLRRRRLDAAGPKLPARPGQKEDGRKHPALTIIAAAPLGAARATLCRLAAVLVCLSLAVWLVALVGGRALCRRALLPVRRMADAAREMGAADLGRRLPAAATGDELEELRRAFNGLLDRLEESFERQRRFTGDASHQLRTPLAAMLGQVEVALRRERPAEEYRRVLGLVQQKAGHLHGIVEALLFLARAKGEARLPERELLDLGEWLPRHLGGRAEGGQAALVARDGPGPYPVVVHPVLLGELLDALLDNARKHGAPGAPVTARLGREGQAVRLSVEDRGPGIAEADLPHLFTPFFRSEATRRAGAPGVGLGLAIARRLAVALGGALIVTSRAGEGSCFTLSLPAAPAPQPGCRPTQPTTTLASPASQAK